MLAATWRRLSHPHISPLIGLATNSDGALAVEVPFYANSITQHNEQNPNADKMKQVTINHTHWRYHQSVDIRPLQGKTVRLGYCVYS